MTLGKRTYGVVAITTIVLMFATTIVSAINNAEAQRPNNGQIVNQESRQNQDTTQRGLVNVGGVQVDAQVGIPIAACAGVISGDVNCPRN